MTSCTRRYMYAGDECQVSAPSQWHFFSGLYASVTCTRDGHRDVIAARYMFGWYPVSGHGDFGHPATGHLTSDIWTLDTGTQDIYCQNGLWTSATKFIFLQ